MDFPSLPGTIPGTLPGTLPGENPQPRHRRRGAAHVFGHRAEAAEDQGGAHRVAEIGKDRQEGVGIPAFLGVDVEVLTKDGSMIWMNLTWLNMP